MAKVYLGLGTNLGAKSDNLAKAIALLESNSCAIVKISSFFESKPQGFESENDFLNQVVLVETDLSPFELLHQTQSIEKEMGRLQKSAQGYSDRVIDIDILLFENVELNHPELIIPHPKMKERDFVQIPLNEIYDASSFKSCE